LRTTLDIDDDVLSAAQKLAEVRGSTAGKVISDLARSSLTGTKELVAPKYRNGLRLMPSTIEPVTPELVERLLEDDV
jgi:hypothetical protein